MSVSFRLFAFAFVVLAHVGHADERPFTPPGLHPAYWCASLISNERQPRLDGFDWLTARIGSFGRHMKRADLKTREVLQMVYPLGAAGVARMKYPVMQTLIGAEAINAFLDDVMRDASRLEAEHPRGRADLPFAFRARPWRRAGQLAVGALTTAPWIGGAAWLATHDRPLWAAVSAGLASYSAITFLVPVVRAIVADGVNWYRLRQRARGAADDQVARGFARRAGQLTANIKGTLAALERGEARGLFDRVVVELPISLSTASVRHKWRPAPTAHEIIAATRASGDGPRPADARHLEARFLAYLDDELGEPVLLVSVFESKHRVDWGF